ncbi:unnamed protein product [Leptidea sinapis]|uniref:Uncharacterized protein n=1 Tax=Leptidea sinapis TaxID=189913 RepID=A0A5E4Q514_9NEOP|nr:unnamed protein product [Leptidea sinapis]
MQRESRAQRGSMELEPPPLHERLLPASPLLLNDRLSEGRSQSLTRAEVRNGFHSDVTAPAPAHTHKHHHDDQVRVARDSDARRCGGRLAALAGRAREAPAERVRQVASRCSSPWGTNESWSVPGSPLPPRAPHRPAD